MIIFIWKISFFKKYFPIIRKKAKISIMNQNKNNQNLGERKAINNFKKKA